MRRKIRSIGGGGENFRVNRKGFPGKMIFEQSRSEKCRSWERILQAERPVCKGNSHEAGLCLACLRKFRGTEVPGLRVGKG